MVNLYNIISISTCTYLKKSKKLTGVCLTIEYLRYCLHVSYHIKMTYFGCKKDIFFVSLLMTLPKISRFLSPVHIWCDQDFCHWLGLMINEVHCLVGKHCLCLFFQDWAQVIFCCNFDRAPVPQAPGCDTVKKKLSSKDFFWVLQVLLYVYLTMIWMITKWTRISTEIRSSPNPN